MIRKSDGRAAAVIRKSDDRAADESQAGRYAFSEEIVADLNRMQERAEREQKEDMEKQASPTFAVEQRVAPVIDQTDTYKISGTY